MIIISQGAPILSNLQPNIRALNSRNHSLKYRRFHQSGRKYASQPESLILVTVIIHPFVKICKNRKLYKLTWLENNQIQEFGHLRQISQTTKRFLVKNVYRIHTVGLLGVRRFCEKYSEYIIVITEEHFGYKMT